MQLHTIAAPTPAGASTKPGEHTRRAEARPASEAATVITSEQVHDPQAVQLTQPARAILAPHVDAGREARHPAPHDVFGAIRDAFHDAGAGGTGGDGRHGQFVPSAASPQGWMEPAIFGSNTFRLSPEPWDTEAYATVSTGGR